MMQRSKVLLVLVGYLILLIHVDAPHGPEPRDLPGVQTPQSGKLRNRRQRSPIVPRKYRSCEPGVGSSE